MQDSNPRPSVYKTAALPAELIRRRATPLATNGEDVSRLGSRLRLCFANPEPETIKKGVEVLAEVCRREFGIPLRSANIDKG